MGVKRILIGAAAGIAGLVGAWASLDYFCGTKYIVNYAYCTARQITEDFDRNEIVEIPVAVYYDGFLQREEIDKCYKAYSMAEDEMMRQFGIKLNMIDSGARGIPKGVNMQYLADIGSRDAIINMYCVSHIYQPDLQCNLGLSSEITNSIQIVSTKELDEIFNVMLHEIGHLFYAEHTENPGCYMYYKRSNIEPHWCDEERETIEKYKKRLW